MAESLGICRKVSTTTKVVGAAMMRGGGCGGRARLRL